jgi:F-type H+-transporting ATPase subunit b
MAQNARTEAPSKAPFPPFQIETFASQLFWLAVVFIALYLLVAKLALPRLSGILAARGQRVADDLAEAERNRERADLALAAYDKALADARDRAQSVANETRDRLAVESEKARHALEAKLNARLAEAEQAILATKTAALSNVRVIAVETAAAVVQRLTGSAPDGAAVEAAVAEALKR